MREHCSETKAEMPIDDALDSLPVLEEHNAETTVATTPEYSTSSCAHAQPVEEYEDIHIRPCSPTDAALGKTDNLHDDRDLDLNAAANPTAVKEGVCLDSRSDNVPIGYTFGTNGHSTTKSAAFAEITNSTPSCGLGSTDVGIKRRSPPEAEQQQCRTQVTMTTCAATAGKCKAGVTRKRTLFIGSRVRKLKRKWIKADIEKEEEKLHAEWTALPKDEVTMQLLAWRYGDLGKSKTNDGEDCDDRLRMELDALISQRAAELNAISSKAAEGAGTQVAPVRPLLERLGFLSSWLPHPAMLVLEMAVASQPEQALDNCSTASQVIHASASHVEESGILGSFSDQEGPQDEFVSVLEAYVRWKHHPDPVERCALWAVVAARARRQHRKLVRIIAAHDTYFHGNVVGDPPNGFDVFCATRSQALPPPLVSSPTPNLCKNGTVGTEDNTERDPIWELMAEAAFLELRRAEKLHWLRCPLTPKHNEPTRQTAIVANWEPLDED